MRLPLAACRFASSLICRFAASPLRQPAGPLICRHASNACRLSGIATARHATPPMLDRLISKLASRYFLAWAALASLIRQLWQVRRTVIKPSIDRPGL